MAMVTTASILLVLLCFTTSPMITANSDRVSKSNPNPNPNPNSRRVIPVNGGPDSVIWVVQLSDLHFSVHHPDRAIDFKNSVGPALSIIEPSLVLITGDLTDGKSKDLLTMKQDEEEWMEYRDVMEDVVTRSGLDKSIFYDLRGNHDNFGVFGFGGAFDFYSNYSLNAQAGRKGNVNSVTLETRERRHLFVGIDSTMAVGLRGPTNLFGHPTNELLFKLDSELSQWDSDRAKPVTKIAFGHFPISFSATSESGKTLKEVFLNHSISVYLCGHLHLKFGKNLKRHHQLGGNFIQSDMQVTHSETGENCSLKTPRFKEFWEWEMGDWRRSRAMRILAIDKGHVSFLDTDLKLGAKRTIILPTFPLDSRLIWTSSGLHEYKCQTMDASSFSTIRALVFSSSPIVSVVARVYDSMTGTPVIVLEAPMRKYEDGTTRDALYATPWHFKAFEDPSPERYWLQIEVIDIRGRSTLSERRPFSVNSLQSKLSWTWREFMVMGCQWDTLYYPILLLSLGSFLLILLIPFPLLKLSKKHYTLQKFYAEKGFMNAMGWVLTELYKLRVVSVGVLGYLFYLVLFPWFSGQVFTDGGQRGYMTYKGWVVKNSDLGKKLEFFGFPDIMVIVLPHLFFVVVPSAIVALGLAMESEMHRVHLLSLSGKKMDDSRSVTDRPSRRSDGQGCKMFYFCVGARWIRKLLIVLCLAILWKHFKSCRALVKAYEMNPLLHFPVYSLSMPLLLVYAVYKTGGH